MSVETAADSRCAVCGHPGRYVRDPKAADPAIWCAEHAPTALAPWVMAAGVLLLLGGLVLGLHLLGRGLPG